jgi:hypothetical protein
MSDFSAVQEGEDRVRRIRRRQRQSDSGCGEEKHHNLTTSADVFLNGDSSEPA